MEEALRRTLEEQETLRVEHRHDMAQLHALHERQLQQADERLQQLRKEHTEEVKRLVDQNTGEEFRSGIILVTLSVLQISIPPS